MAGITSTGLGSGVKINDLTSQLVAAERKPADDRLNRREADILAKISSLGNFKSALSDFQGSLSALKSPGKFQKLSATSSDTSMLTATVEVNADEGNYSLEVKQLAQSHALASKSYTTAGDVVGTGTLTVKFGTTTYNADTDVYTGFAQNADKSALTLNIDATNNTLTGIRDAINKANAGVRASIVNDGSGFRLALNSSDSGAKNSLQITVSGDSVGTDSDTDGLSALTFNATATHMSQTQAAKDAIVSFNGLDVTSQTNTLKETIKGVSVNLLQAQTGKVVNLAVKHSDGDLTKAVDGFVVAYNGLLETVKGLSGYDAKTRQGGILQGDAVVRGGMARLRSELSAFVEGASKILADIGISTQRNGSLALNSEKLGAALASDRNGVTALFTQIGRPSDTGVTYLGATNGTQAGVYAVNVTQAATQGFLNGAAATSFVVGASNDVFKIKINGIQSGDIALTQGASYSGASLAAEIQSRVNGDSALKAGGASVSVAYDSGANRFVVTSKKFGATSGVEITQVDAAMAATLGLSAASGTAGVDVAGTIGGAAAQGKGQELAATGGGAAGLNLLVSGNAGDRGSVSFSRGLIEKLDGILAKLLGSKGAVASRTGGLESDLDRLGVERNKLDERMSAMELRLLKRFNAMDRLVGRLQATGSSLGQQLATLPYATKTKS